MGIIKYNLLPAQKARKHNLNVEINLYPLASELYDELNAIGIIDRISEIRQLGVIKVPKKLQKTRYDYVMLQLYLHQLIKNNLQGHLRLTYNNLVKAHEFSKEFMYKNNKEKPSIGDILQLLTIIYNIGHFYNTFTASRAVTMMASKNDAFKNMVYSSSCSQRFFEVAHRLFVENNYQHFHLLNSLLILEKCNQSKQSVLIATEILYAYINESNLPIDNKLKYAFSIFRNVRTVSYMAYDLQIANTPLTIDLCNEEALLLLLRELLSEYNNNLSSNRLVESISKLLDDSVYNENSNAICYYKISRRMVSLLQRYNYFVSNDYYRDFFTDKESALNKVYSHNRDYVQHHILKLTFQTNNRHLSENLLSNLERINNTRVGYYDRHSGEQTILVSIKKNCDVRSKTIAAFKTMRCAINTLRRIQDILPNDSRFLLCAKFFLFYLFHENPVIIKPTIDSKTCVLCTRGKNSRINEVDKLLKSECGNEDECHETEFMLKYLNTDTTNDTSICIPASILVYQKDAVGRKLCEFDGIIIHPMRKKNQLIFMEAKNTSGKPSYGKKCLKDKLEKLSFNYSSDDITIIDTDALMKYTV